MMLMPRAASMELLAVAIIKSPDMHAMAFVESRHGRLYFLMVHPSMIPDCWDVIELITSKPVQGIAAPVQWERYRNVTALDDVEDVVHQWNYYDPRWVPIGR